MAAASSRLSVPRLLLVQGQAPFDPTSGAAQSMRQTCVLLARAGWDVRAVTTTVCEGDWEGGVAGLVEAAGGPAPERCGAWWRVARDGVAWEMLEVAPRLKRSWQRVAGAAYDARLRELLAGEAPEVVLTFGDDPEDVERRAWARTAGARVVFALHNLAYRERRMAHVDAWLAPTRFLAGRYREAWGVEPEVLPPPLVPVAVPEREPACAVFINPEVAKGAGLVARLAERLRERRPDIPLLVVGGRVPPGHLVDVGRACGVNLAAAPNLLGVPATPSLAPVWAGARCVLVPSVVEEAAGRVALEAMAAGVVPLVSDRGGLPELVGDAGWRLPAPDPRGAGSPDPDPAVVEAWWRALLACYLDGPAYAERSAACVRRAAAFRPERLVAVYDAWFREVAQRRAAG